MVYHNYFNYQQAYDRAKANPALLYSFQSMPHQFRPFVSFMSGMNSPYALQSKMIKEVYWKPLQNRSMVTIGNSRYTYPMTEHQLNTWMNSRSLGNWYNTYIKRG